MLFFLFFINQKPVYIDKKQWNPAEAVDEGLDPMRLKVATDYMDSRLPRAHSLIILKNGKTILEQYYWKGGPQVCDYLHSLGNSILLSLLGIAIESHLIEGLDQSVYDFFPDYLKKRVGEATPVLRIRRLVETRGPLIWGNDNPEFWALLYAKNKVAASIEALAPGQVIPNPARNYAANFLLSMVIQKASSMSIFRYADLHLFRPIGISTYSDAAKEGSLEDVLTGFRLKPLDLTKFGHLVLNNGYWEGKKVIPERWVKEALLKTLEQQPNGGMESLFKAKVIAGHGVFMAMGEGGQYLVIVPQLNLVIAVTSKSRFPLPKISGYETLFGLIVCSALMEAGNKSPNGGCKKDAGRSYYEPNFVFTTSVPEEIKQFFRDFAMDISTKNIQRITGHYAKGYEQGHRNYNSVPSSWRKMFYGGTGELESVEINRLRIEKNRVYLRGVSKYSYANMNEGSLGWFPIENLVKLDGRWKWFGSPEYAFLLDFEAYFDAEIPPNIMEFIGDCSGPLMGDAEIPYNGCFSKDFLGYGGDCFSSDFLLNGASRFDVINIIRRFVRGRPGARLHVRKLETSDGAYLVKGVIQDSALGELDLPPGIRILKEDGK